MIVQCNYFWPYWRQKQLLVQFTGLSAEKTIFKEPLDVLTVEEIFNDR